MGIDNFLGMGIATPGVREAERVWARIVRGQRPLTDLGRKMSIGRFDLSKWGVMNCFPVSASASTSAHRISCGLYSSRLVSTIRR